jgi:hypothetical protein
MHHNATLRCICAPLQQRSWLVLLELRLSNVTGVYCYTLYVCRSQLTKTVSQDKQLANRVNRQAYLYRVGAELKGDKFLAVDDLQNLRDTARSNGHSLRQVCSRSVHHSMQQFVKQCSEAQRVCASLLYRKHARSCTV